MAKKPTYEELEQKVEALMKKLAVYKPSSDDMFRYIFDSASDAIFIHDSTGHIIEVNEAACERLGYSRDELLEMTPMDFNTPEQVQKVPQRVKELCQKGYIRFETGHVARDGKVIPVEIISRTMEYGGERRLISIARDITEHRWAEDALRESEDLLRATLDATADGLLAVNESGQVTHSNSRFADMWRIPKELLDTKDDSKLLDYVLEQLADPEAFLSKVKKLYGTAEKDFDTLHFKDGRIFGRYSRPLVRNGNIAGRVWSFRDITERRQTKKRLQKAYDELENRVQERTAELVNINEQLRHEIEQRKQTEERLKEIKELDEKILYGSPVAFVLHDRDLRILRISRAYKDVTGYEPEEVLGKGVEEFMPEGPSKVHVVEGLKKVRDEGVQIGPRDILAPTLTKRYLTETILPIVDKGGQVSHVLSVLENITGRKETGEALRESEQKHRLLVEKMNDGLGVQDENGLITYVNNSLCKMWGYSSEEVLGRPVTDFLDEENRIVLKKQMEKRRKGKSFSYEIEWKGKDGRKIATIMSPAPILDTEGHFKGSFAVITDVTERKEAQDALRKKESRK
jgi:PAS domain S-box-containing protein